MLEDAWKGLVKETVRRYLPEDYKVFIFGSRTDGTNHDWSDVDVGIMGPEKISFQTLARIKGDFTDSRLPYRVDVVDFAAVTDDFKNAALKSAEYL